MSGKRLFQILCPLRIVPITFLFAYLTVSGAVELHEPTVPKPPPKPPSNSAGAPPNNPHTAPQRHSPTNDLEDQLPYFFILQLPSLLSEEPTWSEWTQWSPCGLSCGAPSKRVRRRHCQGPIESACPGESIQWKACKVMPCPSEKPPLPKIAPAPSGPAAKTEERNPEQTVAIEEGKLENGKMEVTGSMELHEMEAQRNGVPYWKKPEAEKGLEQQRVGSSVEDSPEWHECFSPCPYKVQLRRRWCYLGQYCNGATRDIRVCASGHDGLINCGTVNTTDITEFSDPMNHSSPWTDPHIGWSIWTPWTSCSSECGYHIQTINWSTPCLPIAGQISANCHGRYELVRVCRKQSDPYASPALICGQVENFEHWNMVEDTVVKHRYFFPSSSRIIHAIVIFVLFAPPIILLLYWLLSRAHRPRYESLPSASAPGDSAVDANGQPTISADVTSALGPNHLTMETDPDAWKTV